MKVDQVSAIVFLIFPLSILLDNFTGLLIEGFGLSEGGLSPSQLIRMICVFLLFKMLISKRFQNMIFLLIPAFYTIILEIFFGFIHQTTAGVVLGLVTSFKITFLLLCLSFFVMYYRSHHQIFLRYLNYSLVLSSLIILMTTILGIGRTTYGDSGGGNIGYFASGNGISVFIGAGVLFSTYALPRHRSNSLSLLMALTALSLIGTKSSLIFIIATVLLLFIKGRRKMAALISVSALSLLSAYWAFFLKIFEVISYRISNTSASWYSLFFSGRESYLADALQNVSASPIKVLFGGGAFIGFDIQDPSYDIVEMDLFDVFFFYGAPVTIGLLIFTIYVCSRIDNFALAFVFLLIVFHSYLLGHVLFVGYNASILALIICEILQGRKLKS